MKRESPQRGARVRFRPGGPGGGDPWRRIIGLLSGNPGEEIPYRELCEQIARGFGLSRILLATVAEGDSTLVARAGYDPDIGTAAYTALRWLYRISLQPDSDGRYAVAAWSVLNNEQVHVPDVTSYDFRPDETVQRTLLVRALGTKEYVITPIPHRGEAVGILAADRKGQDRRMDAGDRELLRAVASLIGFRAGPRLAAGEEQGSPRLDGPEGHLAPGEYLATLVHDLRAPLQSIIGFAELLDLERAGPLTPEQREFVRRIETGGDEMLERVDELLELVRASGGGSVAGRRLVDPADLFESTVDSLSGKALAEGVRLEYRTEDGIPMLWGERARLIRLLENLVDNALEATPEGGQVLLRCRLDGSDDERPICLEVIDQGPGIDLEEAAHILERRTPEPPWSGPQRGLGLLSARLTSESHGGRIRAGRNRHGGTTITVRLPTRSGPEGRR